MSVVLGYLGYHNIMDKKIPRLISIALYIYTIYVDKKRLDRWDIETSLWF